MKTIKEIYSYREMIIGLVRKDLRGRYKGTFLGFLWTFVNPLLQLGVYTIVFSTILPSNIERFYLHLFVALIPWLFFATSLNEGCAVIWSNQEMVKKIYFPREVLPISLVIGAFVNMLFSFVVVFIVIFVSGVTINPIAILCLPLFLIMEFILALGIVFIVSAITVFFRDLQHIFGILTMAWMFFTPIVYSFDIVPEHLQPLFRINPMTPVIIGIRDILFYARLPQLETLFKGYGLAFLVLIIGFIVFTTLKKRFAEEL